MIKNLILNPVYQGALILVLMIPLQLICRIAGEPVTGWNIGAVLILIFCLINAAAGITVTAILFYLLKSAGVLFLLLIVTPFISYIVTGLSLDEFGADAMVFLAPFIYYPVFIAVMGVVRFFIK
jgi:hypothetical protein